MNKYPNLIKFAFLILLTLIVISCKGETNKSDKEWSKTNTEKEETYTNPFDYCKAIGTIGLPDSRYVGTKVPEMIARGLQKAFGIAPDTPLDVFGRGTYWRCMDGKVYACNVGANLPCEEKADTSRKPSDGIINFCNSNPDAEVIPAYVIGRAAVYEWRCRGTEPIIVRQTAQPNSAGYISNIWYKISPS
jgi:hypothetical protein